MFKRVFLNFGTNVSLNQKSYEAEFSLLKPLNSRKTINVPIGISIASLNLIHSGNNDNYLYLLKENSSSKNFMYVVSRGLSISSGLNYSSINKKFFVEGAIKLFIPVSTKMTLQLSQVNSSGFESKTYNSDFMKKTNVFADQQNYIVLNENSYDLITGINLGYNIFSVKKTSVFLSLGYNLGWKSMVSGYGIGDFGIQYKTTNQYYTSLNIGLGIII